MKIMVSENWLKSDNDEKFSKAAMCCEHAGAFCIQDGYCHREGKCFNSERQLVARAIRRINNASNEAPDDVKAYMLEAARLIDIQCKCNNDVAENKIGE